MWLQRNETTHSIKQLKNRCFIETLIKLKIEKKKVNGP